MECDYTSLDLLMEDLSDIINEYIYDALLEDVSALSSADDKKKKHNIFVRFWNTLVKIMKFIGQKIREFYNKFKTYVRRLLDGKKCIVKEDCDVSHEIITGVDNNLGGLVNFISKLFSYMERKDGTGDIYDELDKAEEIIQNEFFQSEKKHLTKGTVMDLKVLESNLSKVEKNHDKATQQIENYAKKIEKIDPNNGVNDNIKNNALMRAQGIITKYKNYLNRIMNEMIDFIKTKISVVVYSGSAKEVTA